MMDERVSFMVDYVQKNYSSEIHMDSLAETLYLSVSALSRLFKKHMGIYFADYVRKVRLEHAVDALLHSDKRITDIAVDCGFATPSGLNRAFYNCYGVSPSQYRRQSGESRPSGGCRPPAVSVDVDADAGESFKKIWNKGINMGAVSDLLLVNVQQHTLYLKEKLGFSHVRLWNLFSQKLMITDGSENGPYYYDTVDTVFDFLVSNHIRPFLDFGRRPHTAMRSCGREVYYENPCVRFVSKKAWENALEDFLKHMLRRYGRTELEGWIFEFSCSSVLGKEGDYYPHEQYDFFNAYAFGFRLIKSIVPGAKVGGFSGIVHYDDKSSEHFFELCKKAGCMPDFVSFIVFPYESGNGGYERSQNENFDICEVERIHRLMERAHVSCPLYITEWNVSLSSRNYINDSCFRAVCLLRNISCIWGKADMFGIWMGSDWTSSYIDSRMVANGGSGLLSKNNICKPVFYGICFLNQLGRTLLWRTDSCLVTKDSSGDIVILCWNFRWYEHKYFERSEDEICPEECEQLFSQDNRQILDIKIRSLPAGSYVIRRQTVSPLYGSLLNEWKQFGYEKDLRSDDVAYLRQVCIPKVQMERQTVSSGMLQLDIDLALHEFSLIHIYSSADIYLQSEK